MIEHQNKVELVGTYGSDETHALSAWTSTSRDLNDEKRGRMGKLLTMLATDGHHCYDSETEILTENGWKHFYDLSYEDKVAAVDIKTKEVKFEVPQDIFSDNYNELLYHIKGQQLDLLVTKGHRMVVSQKRNPKIGFGEFEFQTVEEVQGQTRKYLKSGQINNTTKLEPKFAQLLGFFIGDGHAATKNTISFHIKKDREINFLQQLDLSIKSNKNNRFDITDHALGQWFRDNCYNKNGEKKLPDNYLQYSREDFLNLLEGLKNSDGTTKRNTFVYYTTSPILKNQLLALAAIHNSVFTVSVKNWNNTNWSPLFILTFSNRNSPEVALSQKNRSLTYVENYVPYTGKVYCVTVSTGAIIVKRNDKVAVSGNTPFEKSSQHFLVTTDIATHIHILKHRIGVSFNGESARYKELKDDKFYIPEDWDSDEQAMLIKHCEDSIKQYHECLARLVAKGVPRKRAKESARFYLPYANQITADVMFNFRSFMHFAGLRASEHAQLEVRQIAYNMLHAIDKTEQFALSLTAFGWTKEKIYAP